MSLDTTYTLHLYVEYLYGDGEGVLDFVEFKTPVNSFTVHASLVSGTLGTDSMVIEYTPSANGKSWGVILPDGKKATPNIVYDRTGVVGGDSCRWADTAILASTNKQHALTECHLQPGTKYLVVVYIETTSLLANGAFSYLSIETPSTSNWFVTNPAFVGAMYTQSTDTLKISYQTKFAGKSWAVVVNAASVGSFTTAKIKARTDAAGTTNCGWAAVSDTTSSVQRTLTDCALLTNTAYTILVHTEDDHGLVAGYTYLLKFTSSSNDFSSAPAFVNPNTDTMILTYTPMATGYTWGMVVSAATHAGGGDG